MHRVNGISTGQGGCSIFREGQTIENTIFLVPVLKEFIRIKGDQEIRKEVENIKFENLVFEVAGYHTPADGNEPAGSSTCRCRCDT